MEHWAPAAWTLSPVLSSGESRNQGQGHGCFEMCVHLHNFCIQLMKRIANGTGSL